MKRTQVNTYQHSGLFCHLQHFLCDHKYIVHNLMCISIARQRLGEHIPAKRKHAKEGRPLLGTGPINTPP
jgi:hypothetical protein